jgi:hypothetical protein
MQYMLFCCFDEARWDALPETQRDQIMRDYQDLVHSLQKSGQYRGGGKLHATPTAKRVHQANGKRVITDGPFAETKEHIGGYHLVECEDLDEALSIAARFPTLPAGGVVEVRPLLQALEGALLAAASDRSVAVTS